MTWRRNLSSKRRGTPTAVAFDAVSPGAAVSGGSGIVTWQHTCVTGTMLFVGLAVGQFDGGRATAYTRTVTYDGHPLTSVGVIDSGLTLGQDDGFAELFYQVFPTTGSAKPVVVTVTGGTGTGLYVMGGSVSYSNTFNLGTSVTGACDLGGTPSVSVPSATGHEVIAVFVSGTAIANPTDTQRVLNNLTPANGAGNMLIQDQAGATTAVLGADTNGDIWGWVAVDIVPGTPSPIPVTPTISSITPNPAPAGAVTIHGTNYAAPATVNFDGISASGVVVDSVNQITCNAPAHADGVANVTVTTSTGTSDPFPFSYQAATVHTIPYTIPIIIDQ